MQTSMPALSVAAVLSALSGVAATPAKQPEIVDSPVEKIFVPHGFDDNDVAEVILQGHFPNTCFKTGTAEAAVDPITGSVTITAKAYRYRGTGCAQVLVPFTQSVKLGLLAGGRFKVQVAGHPELASAPLVVATSHAATPDDFLYAPVSQVTVEAPADGQAVVRVQGEYPYMFIGCMAIREVRTYMSPGNTLVVMPIAEILADGPACEAQRDIKEFDVAAPVATPLGEGYMIHVRVLNGNALNRFVEWHG